MLSEDQKRKLAQGKENSPVEAPKASTSKSSASTSPKKVQANPKHQLEGKSKSKGKGKAQVEQALPTELQDSQEREDSHGQCVQYGKNSDGIQKQGRGNIEPIFFKEVDLVKLVNQIESCNKEIITKFKTFEYIQQKLGNEILQVKESQKTIIGLEHVNKDNIFSLTQICARIESKNELPRQSTPILDRNVINLNNDLQHTVSTNAEVETACNFEEISRLEGWPNFSGEGEYNHMEFMKTIDMFKEDFNIPDGYIDARLHSLFTKSEKKWYYKMRQDHGKHSWPWWREQIASKWENDSWKFKMENSFEDAIFNI
ncbi:hypothetical protein O181_032669 [Austropuccinia psidii MF-1]|uniref:Uncharacterized protein n=1 Tax=Austropuccinia psidii MF-1 TaxID=1389203 RepID=A0A9Q3H7R8_9BASI|nr:hypothetical protein [Austropuccinia psidii MF-1]